MEKIWVIAADNARARLFQAEHITGPITEVRDIVNPEARLQDRELLADASGRSASSGGSGLAAYDEASEKQHQSQLFARDVVDEIEKLRSAGELERFHVLAQPEFLGLLRAQYSRPLQKCLGEEVVSHATPRPPDEIRELLPWRM